MLPNETPYRIEPCFPETIKGELVDLLAELPAAANRLGGRIHEKTARSLADLVRSMNCYYSNKIENHNTKPRDIERALNSDFDHNEKSRNLQLEARQHIRLQKMIDGLHEQGQLPEPASRQFLRFLHAEFYRDAPEAMLLIEGAGRSFRMTPGEFRTLPEHDNEVGRHLPPSSSAVERFMEHFEDRYRLAGLGSGARLIALAAAHHRFNFIHPFSDGNGRVSRLMSHAMALQGNIGAHGLWSISRGLARSLPDMSDYKLMMHHADMPRQGDLDGRGNLSERALAEFIVCFLRVCLDQINFMASLFSLDRLSTRLAGYAGARGWREEAVTLLTETMHRGEIARGSIESITGLGERTARALLSDLVADGILGSDTPKGPVSLRFPVKTLTLLFPQLYPAEGELA